MEALAAHYENENVLAMPKMGTDRIGWHEW
jgi:hypothetical protein